jgi:type IV pilus assembly protein PilB
VETDLALLSEARMSEKEIEGIQFYRGKGCDACNNTGYKGRVGLFELMVMNDNLRDMVMANASTDELRDKAQEFGMETLRDAGMAFAAEGITSFEEVVRETVMD